MEGLKEFRLPMALGRVQREETDAYSWSSDDFIKQGSPEDQSSFEYKTNQTTDCTASGHMY